MSSFNLAELSPVVRNGKENISFRKSFKASNLKLSKPGVENEQPIKGNPNKPLGNQNLSQDLSIDFLDSIEKWLKTSFIDNNTHNDTVQNILSRNPKKNSYLQVIACDKKFERELNGFSEDRNANGNNLDSLAQKSNNQGLIQDSILNRLLDSRSFDQESPSLVHNDEIMLKGGDKKMDQNDTYLFQIEQILKNFEDDEEKQIFKITELPEKKKAEVVFVEKTSKLNEHIMIQDNKTHFGPENKKIVICVKKKASSSKCAIF